jgi:hypothetical protein
MHSNAADKIYILGLSTSGRTFRPSDWAERLAGVMSQFRPGGRSPAAISDIHRGAFQVLSRASGAWWWTPSCVNMKALAWDFCMNFAKDNDLQVTQGEA